MNRQYFWNDGPIENDVTTNTDKVANDENINTIYANAVNIEVKYFVDGLEPLYPRINNLGVEWTDVRAAKDITIKPGEIVKIPLGFGIKLPKGFEAILAPRSSTLKNYGIMMGNSMGIFDTKYCGDNDEWLLLAYAIPTADENIKAFKRLPDGTGVLEIHKNDRIAQFRIQQCQPRINFITVDHLDDVSRGGFGSTGMR